MITINGENEKFIEQQIKAGVIGSVQDYIRRLITINRIKTNKIKAKEEKKA